MEKNGLCEPKGWWKCDIYWLLESFLFDLFKDGECIFFEPKSWWKDNIYWLLKRSCFEPFGYGKYGFFWAKILPERLYLLALFEISMIFQDLRNTVFCAVYIKPRSGCSIEIFDLFLEISWFDIDLKRNLVRRWPQEFIKSEISVTSKIAGNRNDTHLLEPWQQDTQQEQYFKSIMLKFMFQLLFCLLMIIQIFRKYKARI